MVLRILDCTPPESTPDSVVMTARHALLELLAVALQAIERQMIAEEEYPHGVTPPQPGDVLEVTIKLLKFALGLPAMDVPPAMPKPDFVRLAISFLRVLAVCAILVAGFC